MSAAADGPEPGPSDWRLARVTDRIQETPRAATLRLEAEGWRGHLAGQRVDVRLTAEDGYQATRSYSIASAPADGTLDLTVEEIDDGEVSPYLVEEAMPGDELEIRGPIGGWFTWRPSDPGPLVLIGGGSGLVPLRSMAREAVVRESATPLRLLISTRSAGDLLYAQEIATLADRDEARVIHTLTRRAPEGWTGPTGRIDPGLVGELLAGIELPGAAFVCGPTGFVERAADLLLAAGLPPDAIRTERFGPSA
ncbi:MAG: ferredoxin reductase [Solirubrobacteraceae bacterium]|nr:ferredoxin reductase [Solirubrobacteraceae bacterium]